MHLRVFLSLTISGGDKKNKGAYDARKHGSNINYQILMFLGDGTHSKGDPDLAHLTFTQKSKCGGGW